MKIKERWLVEGVRVEGGGKLRVEFDSRQEFDPSVATGPTKASTITSTYDGDDQVVMSMQDGKPFGEKVGEHVDVTIEIDDGRPQAPQAEPAHRRSAREVLEIVESLHTAGRIVDTTILATIRKLLR